MTRERNLDEATAARLSSLLSLGDPSAEVALAYRVKEALAEFYGMAAIDEARERLSEIVERIGSLPTPRAAKAGTYPFALVRKDHGLPRDPLTNAPTEELNNLLKRVKRVAFGFANFENYRIRALLYAGKPNWRVLDSIVVE